MNEVYNYVGYAVTWGFIIIITLATVSAIIWGLFHLLYRKIWMNDWFAYNIRRVVIPTEKLREGYAAFKMNAYWSRYTFMYRLRNIKKQKHLSPSSTTTTDKN